MNIRLVGDLFHLLVPQPSHQGLNTISLVLPLAGYHYNLIIVWVAEHLSQKTTEHCLPFQFIVLIQYNYLLEMQFSGIPNNKYSMQ